MQSVRITGLGLCTPLGATLGDTWAALLAGKFITDHSRAAGEYDAPRVCALADRAAREAVKEAGWNDGDLREAGLVVGTSKGPIESWIPSQSSVLSPQHLCLGLSGIASSLNFIGGPRLTISTACASGLHALIRGAMLLNEGYSRVLVVAAESSLHPLFLASFKRLGVLAPPEIGCRPFDLERQGFLVSEAAAAVCLEKKAGGLQVERFALGGDATHLTGADPQGRMLRRLLATVIDGRAVDLIHAHGTGTEANDAVELAAIESCLSSLSVLTPSTSLRVRVSNVEPLSPHPFDFAQGEGEQRRTPQSSSLIYSHKGALGHSLGAAGLISVVMNCMIHRMGCVPPSVRTYRPMAMARVRHSTSVERLEVRRSIAIASGFGGAGAAVAIASNS